MSNKIQPPPIPNLCYKIILVGDINVGKSAIFQRYINQQFIANKTVTITIDFKMKLIHINNQQIKLYVWDTAGSQKHRSIISTYFKGCQGAIIVFDLARQTSFENVKNIWYPLIKAKTPDTVIVIVGNKCDLHISVAKDCIEGWCMENNLHYIETSVKQNINIDEVFNWLTNKIYQQKSSSFLKSDLKLTNLSDKPKKKCCKS